MLKPEEGASISRERLMVLVYVGIALSLALLTVAQTYATVQWWSAVDNLDFKAETPSLHLDNASLGYPYVSVSAVLDNPTGFNGLQVTYMVYTVFFGGENFTVNGSSEIASYGLVVQHNVPPLNGLNVSAAVPVFSDVVHPISSFLENQTGVPKYYVQASVQLRSVYGTFSNDYCYLFPGNTLTVCPQPRPPPTCMGSVACGGG